MFKKLLNALFSVLVLHDDEYDDNLTDNDTEEAQQQEANIRFVHEKIKFH